MPGVASPSNLAWVSGVSARAATPRRDVLSRIPRLPGTVARTCFPSLMAFGPTPFSLGSGGEPQRIRGHLVLGIVFRDARRGSSGRPPAAALRRSARRRAGGGARLSIVARAVRRRAGRAAAADRHQRPAVHRGRRGSGRVHRPGAWAGRRSSGCRSPRFPRSTRRRPHGSTERGTLWLRVMGRLESGRTMSQAASAVATIAAALEQTYPETNKQRTAVVSSAAYGLSPGRARRAAPADRAPAHRHGARPAHRVRERREPAARARRRTRRSR